MPTTPNNNTEQAAELASLRAENDRLKGQLAQATARTPNVAPAAPFLTEGARQELITFGVSGGLNLRSAARRFPDADLSDATEEAKSASAEDEVAVKPAGIRGFDYVYPSVAPGVLAESEVGAPGTSGAAK